MMFCGVTAATLVLLLSTAVRGFNSALFAETAALKKTAPSLHEGYDVELPDFDELFGRIQQVSPLARQVIQGRKADQAGFAFIDDSWPSNLKWQKVEANKRRLVHQIEKIDNFQGHNAPIVRFRASMQGPCHGDLFARFIMNVDERKRWDPQIEQVYEIHPLRDLDEANIAMGFGKYGDCSVLGVGYCRTKSALGVSPREQLTLCGIQHFACGSTIMWGTEMEESHNHMFPQDERCTRAKSHLFCTTLTPTGPNSFDVEYALQLEVGGNMPTWLTNPIMYDTIKKLFKCADGVYRGKCDTLESFLREREEKDHDWMSHGLLMTP